MPNDDRGRPYILIPVQRQQSRSFQGMPEYNDDLDSIFEDANRQVEVIQRYAEAESLPRKSIRKLIDWSLSGPGIVATGATGAYEVYSHKYGGPNHAVEWAATVVTGLGGMAVYELFRRPFVGARNLFHQWHNPWSPAAQSNGRIRETIEESYRI